MDDDGSMKNYVKVRLTGWKFTFQDQHWEGSVSFEECWT